MERFGLQGLATRRRQTQCGETGLALIEPSHREALEARPLFRIVSNIVAPPLSVFAPGLKSHFVRYERMIDVWALPTLVTGVGEHACSHFPVHRRPHLDRRVGQMPLHR